MSFEELGPSFVKLGQLLATRPDLVPQDYVNEFARLHDQVQPLSFEQVKSVLEEELTPEQLAQFEAIEEKPLGSASIAQAHKAVLKGKGAVVIKIQRPGIVKVINDDLDVLYFLAELLYRYIPEVRPFNPIAIVDEFFKTLELETNFIVEANNLRRFAKSFPRSECETSRVIIPEVYLEYTTEKVLVMEFLAGTPLSVPGALEKSGADPQAIIKAGLQSYLKMVFIDGVFHGDMHAGNYFVMPDNKIGLIDFGVVGRLSPKNQTSITRMLMALAKEDYERLAYEYVDLAPFNERINVDLFAKDLRELIAPYYGLTLKNVNIGKVLMSSAGLAARHHLIVPSDMMLFFKSIVSIESIGRKIDPQFDFLQASLEFAGEIAQVQMSPQKWMTEATQALMDSKSLLFHLPRQLSFFIRKMSAPDYASRVEVKGLDEMKQSIEVSFNLLFLGLIIGSLILSASFVSTTHTETPTFGGLPVLGFTLYVIAGLLGVVAFINYIKK